MTAETFHSWQRSRLTEGATWLPSGRLSRSLPVQVTVTDQPSGQPAHTMTVAPQVEILGPGDVRGITDQAFTRHHPESDAVDVGLDVMPYVELAAPDLPWRYSPDPPGDGPVRPWLVLVCGPEDKDGLQLGADGRTVTLSPAVQAQFPPDSLHLSAHVHQASSGRTLARLLAAANPEGHYQLAAGTVHLAAVVPAFQATVDACHDPPGSAATSDTAWPGQPAASVELPCLHWWRFTTGTTPPFEEVAGRLTQPAGDGQVPGLGQASLTPSDGSWRLMAAGALRTTGGTELPDPGEGDQPAIQAMLAKYRAASGDEVGLVCWPEAAGALPSSQSEDWWTVLDDHPVARVAAGLGAWCGIEWQDQLVASVREAIGAVDVLNQKVRYQASGDRATHILLDGVLAQSSDGCLRGLQLAGPAARRLWTGGDPGLAAARWQALAGAALPPQVLSSAARRALRSGTARRSRASDTLPPIGLAAALAAAQTPEQVTGLRPSAGAQDATSDAHRPGQVWVPEEGGETFEAALEAAAIPPLSDPVKTDLEELACEVAATIGWGDSDRPSAGLSRVWRTVDAHGPKPEGWEGDKPIEVCARITPEPWTFLRDHAPDWLLPGIGTMRDDSVLALRTNPAFIDAFLAGLNAQLLAELRWRNVPTAAGCTPVRGFWPTRRAQDGTIQDEIVTYRDSTEGLGRRKHSGSPATAGTDLWVVLIRSWLFVRWPHTQVWLQGPDPQVWLQGPDPQPETRAPVIAGRVDRATVLFAFDTAGLAPGSTDPQEDWRSWFLVLAEPPVGLGFQHTLNDPGSNPPSRPPDPTTAASFAVRHLDQPARAMIPVNALGVSL